MWNKWFAMSMSDVVLIVISTACVYGIIIFYTRVTGLRSFSKMSAADFAMTVAIGSLLGGAIVAPSPTVLMVAVALAALFGAQWLIASLRRSSESFRAIVDNRPTLLMVGREILEDNLRASRVTTQDLHAKLREANVWNYDQVLAVVFETTGIVSVLRKQSDAEHDIDLAIFEGIESADRLR